MTDPARGEAERSGSGARRDRRSGAGLLAAVALVVGVLGAAATASAQGKKVIRLEQITVEGRIQKPQAFYILQRSNLNFDVLERNESFLPKVVKSVEKDPF